MNKRMQQSHPVHGDQAKTKDKKIVNILAAILKKIEPFQIRKKEDSGKETLFFSLKQTA